jgi:fatty-acyl-CoA synthase
MTQQQQDEQSVARSIGIAQVFRASARQFADRIAVASEDGIALTYRELDELASRVAAFLCHRGVRRGDRVAVMSDPTPGYIAVNLAGAKLGVTVVGVNTRWAVADVRYGVEDSQAKLVFFSARYQDIVEEAVGLTDAVELGLDSAGAGGALSLSRALGEVGTAPVEETGAPEDIHTIIYTSGTTGHPKGAMISQAAAAVRAMRLVSWFQLTPQDAFLGWLPLFHTSGEEPLNATFLSGGRYLSFRRANPDQLVDAVERRGGTWSWLLPGMFGEFLDAAHRTGASLSGLRFAGGYGNLLPARLIDDLVSRGAAFYDLFGQTETSLLVASNRIDSPGEREWKKLPTPFLDIQIVRSDGAPADLDEPGECVVRGPSVMSGYLNQPEATQEVFRGGWLHTGDLLQRTADGALRFVDREKYLIKTGGENVYPLEVEVVLNSHPDVAEACVVGVPDERWGETVKAFIVLRAGRTTDARELDTYCRARLAGFKRPRIVEFITAGEVPRSATGKIMRGPLAERPTLASQQIPAPADA